MGRGALLFAALMLGFAIVLGAWQHAWRDAAFWLAIAVFMACYGMLIANMLPRLHRVLLVVGVIAGGSAFWLALQAAFGG